MFADEKKACNLFLYFAFVLVKGKTYVDRKMRRDPGENPAAD